MSPILTCPCGKPVDVTDPPYSDLVAVNATVLCEDCDRRDLDDRQAVVAHADDLFAIERTSRVQQLMTDAGIPKRERTTALNNFAPTAEQREAYAWATHWARDGGILTLSGPKGCGKTSVAARVASQRLARGGRLAWRSTVDIVAGFWAADEQVKTDSQRLVLSGTGALVLDDLDIERDTPAARDTLGSLIDRWYRTEQPLLVTTNATSEDLARQFGHTGERIASRLQAGPWIALEGPDLRARGVDREGSE